MTDLDHAIEPGFRVPASERAPAHCRVRGVVNRAIRFEVTLPDDWNGRMMFSTVGGAAGFIGDTTSLLGRGFAMASTDTGHEGQDRDYVRQPEALLDYAYRGVHLATAAAKRVIRRYYGREIDYSYLDVLTADLSAFRERGGKLQRPEAAASFRAAYGPTGRLSCPHRLSAGVGSIRHSPGHAECCGRSRHHGRSGT